MLITQERTAAMHYSPTRRDLSMIALLGVSAFAAQAAGAAEAVPISTEDALKVLDPWLDAVVTGDPAVVEKVLAPEYQTLRSNGVGHDKASYLKSLPRQRASRAGVARLTPSPGYSAFTAVSTFASESFASPNSSVVCGS